MNYRMNATKLMYGLAASTLLMATASCETSFETPQHGEYASVSMNIGLDDINSRAYSSGQQATVLQYAVYEKVGDEFTIVNPDEYKKTDATISMRTQLSFRLLTDHTYTFVFWAAGEDAPYEVSLADDGATMTANYEGVTANDDALDAFFACKELTVNGDLQMDVKMQRPFAQINIGTNDYASAAKLGYEPTQSAVTVSNVYTELNLITGEADNEQTVALGYADIDTTEKFPVAEHQYIAMAYVLTNADKQLVDVTFSHKAANGDAKSRTIGSVPVQRNHRTNIYGQLLTNVVDPDVEIDPGFGDPDNNIMVKWDGQTVTKPTPDEDGNYSISSADEFAGLSQIEGDFEGVTITLESDFDMTGHEFPALAANAQRSSANMTGTGFKGTFDGNNKTIRNLKITSGTANEATGFIGYLDGGEVKDVKFENVTIETASEQAGIIGVVKNGGKVSGITVESGHVSGAQATGGVVGRVIAEGSVENCVNKATVSSQAYNVGGVVGAAYYTNGSELITVTGCENHGTVTGKSNAIGGVVGLSTAVISECHNYGPVTGSTASVGGVVGEQKSAGSIKGCTNNATVNGGSKAGDYGVGGIVGWIRYDNGDAYSNQNEIEVSGCTNNAAISGWTGVGGIVGVWYMAGKCTQNKNYAPTITAFNQFVAGIVGNSQWTGTKPDKIEGYTDQLEVSNNVSTTTRDAITGGSSDLYVYRNDSSRVTGYDTNTQDEN